MMLYKTKMDALDADGNRYDFVSIFSNGAYTDRKTTTAALKEMMDGTLRNCWRRTTGST